jgi:hypothetical protein
MADRGEDKGLSLKSLPEYSLRVVGEVDEVVLRWT